MYLRRRLRLALSDHGVAASIGSAERKPHRGLLDAWQRADTAMYEDKCQRKAARP